MTYYGQYKQDEYLDNKFFHNKKSTDEHPLYFLDIGADDGISLSNTYYYEKELGWKGLLFEPNLEMAEEAAKIRSNPVLTIALSNRDGFAKFQCNKGYTRTLSGLVESYDPNYAGENGRIAKEQKEYGGTSEIIEVKTRLLHDVLDEYGIKDVEFASLDTEGSELLILENFQFDRFNIKIFTMENNYDERKHRIFMKSKGYKLHSRVKIDDIYVKIGCEYDRRECL